MIDFSLALHGGRPARAKPMPPNYPGALLIGEEEMEAVRSVLQSQSLFRYYGPGAPNRVRALEERMATDLGVPYTLGVTSCTAALMVSLKALGIGYGDKVVVPANTFIATAGAVVSSQAVPVFADIDESLNLDPDRLVKVLDDEVKAIIAVHILGAPARMDAVQKVATHYGLPVIEDVAQSCGGSYQGKKLGSMGAINAFSFQLNKMLTAGEGGAVTTSNATLFERAVRYHDQGEFREHARYGLTNEDDLNFSGQNYRMSEVTGAILNEQWKKLEYTIETMRRYYKRIKNEISLEVPTFRWRLEHDEDGNTGSNLGFILPNVDVTNQFIEILHAENIHLYRLYGGQPVYMKSSILEKRSAETRFSPYDFPFRNPVIYSEDMCPTARDLMSRTVFLPVSPILTELDVDEIIHGLVKAGRYLYERGMLV